MEHEKIAIVLATYNPNLGYFQKQIESIKNQTYQNWVCHIVDDCSETEYQIAIQKILVKDSRFIFHFHNNNLNHYHEGFFGPPLEMMACGGVCIVSDVTGYDEYIKDEYNALVIPNGDVNLAHQALKRLINDKDLYRKLQENGKLTSDSMQWEDSINKLEIFYQNLSNQEKTFHVKGERVEYLQQLLVDHYFATQQMSKLESMIVKIFKKIKKFVPLSLRLWVKNKL